MRITDFAQLMLDGPVAAMVDDSVAPPIRDYDVVFPSRAAAEAWLEDNRSRVDILGNEWLAGRVAPDGPVLVFGSIRSRQDLAFPAGTMPLNPVVARRLLGGWQVVA